MMARPPHRPRQFGVAAVFELTAACSVAAAASPIIGSVASSLLIAATLALAGRRGVFVLMAILGALLAAEHGSETAGISNSFERQVTVALLFAGIVGWYRLRRRAPAE
ncbi:MAG: hypothetical protein U0836_26110 [Pirellulales bacterium]